MAKGDFIAFLDADDFWLPDFLKKTSEFLFYHPEAIAVLTGWIKILDKRKKILVPPLMVSLKARELKPNIINNFFDFWAVEGHVQTGAILIRREAIQLVGLQREDLRNSQDLEYWAMIATFGSWGFIPEPLYVNNSRLAS